jgi:hypothetical protein
MELERNTPASKKYITLEATPKCIRVAITPKKPYLLS